MSPNEEHLSIEELHRLFRYEDGKLYNRITRNSRAVIGAEVGCMAGKGYLEVQLNKRKYMISRVIWAMHNGRWPESKLQIDHEDGVRDNNKIENLREVTGTQNNLNRKGVKGYCKQGNKWRAYIKHNGKSYTGPTRCTEAEAIQDRKDLVEKYF